MAKKVILKSAAYFVSGVDLKKRERENVEVEHIRDEVDRVVDKLKDALANKPETLERLGKSNVPKPPESSYVKDCSMCSYTKVVNFVCVVWDQWANGNCENCGLQINSYTVVENGVVVEDVIEGWGYMYT